MSSIFEKKTLKFSIKLIILDKLEIKCKIKLIYRKKEAFVMINELVNALKLQYELDVININPVKGGWAALAFVLKAKDGKSYFLKAYEKSRSSTYKNIRYIRQISKVTAELFDECELKDNIVLPIKTIDGTYYYSTENYVLSLFAFLDATTVGDKELSPQKKLMLANIVKKLHYSVDKLEFDPQFPRETFNAQSAQFVLDVISQEESVDNSKILNILYKFEDRILESINICLTIAQRYKYEPPKFVLCHTDIHKWNMMESNDNLWLIDFENLKLAPKENDFFALEDYRDEFEEVYPDYNLDIALVEYYARLRVFDDIYDEIEALSDEGMSDEYYKEHEENLILELDKI